MTPRERIQRALAHEETDLIPLDLGATDVTGIHVSTYARFREALGLEPRRPRLIEPLQMLAQVEMDVVEAAGLDAVPVSLPGTVFGLPLKNWKPWRMPDGTEIEVPGDFHTTRGPDGTTYLHPQGDLNAAPSGSMPAGGYYFDPVPRQQPLDLDRLDPQEWVDDMYHVYQDEELRYLEETAQRLYHDTDRALVGWLGEGGFGDIALVPGLGVSRPRGIRDPEQWIMAHVQYPDYIKGVYRLQCDIALRNLQLLYEAVGDTLQVIGISGTDFGTQNGPFISPDMYRDIYQPFHRELNDWIHQHTPWKTFYHTCGSVMALLDDMVNAGVDILNPVQCSAAEMDPATLKSRYGDRLVFWGGGVDNQHTLPFGTPEEVRAEAESRCRILGAGGGFVFNPVHNVQPGTPMPNLMAMLDVLKRRFS